MTEEEIEKQIEVREHNKKNAFVKMLEDKGGRDFIWDLLAICGIFHQYGSLSTEEANYTNGKKFVGLEIHKTIMELSPDKYIKMMEENNG